MEPGRSGTHQFSRVQSTQGCPEQSPALSSWPLCPSFGALCGAPVCFCVLFISKQQLLLKSPSSETEFNVILYWHEFSLQNVVVGGFLLVYHLELMLACNVPLVWAEGPGSRLISRRTLKGVCNNWFSIGDFCSGVFKGYIVIGKHLHGLLNYF